MSLCKNMMRRNVVRVGIAYVVFAWLLTAYAAAADEPIARAHYLANAGVMIERGETKILFDPLYRNGYDTYEFVPADTERALFVGEPPFDGIDAVFVSHYHGDHFSPDVMLAFLQARCDVRLYVPWQALTALIEAGASESILDRTEAVSLEYGDEPIAFDHGAIQVEAVRIPHAGWPDRVTDVENIAWRVTLDDATTVVHLGDADTKPLHFELHPDHWHGVDTDLALPPYWYFTSPRGQIVLEQHIRPDHAIGVHVPAEMPDDPDNRPTEWHGFDLFTVPGEKREIAEQSE